MKHNRLHKAILLASLLLCLFMVYPALHAQAPVDLVEAVQEAPAQDAEAARLSAAFDQSWILAFVGIFLLGLALNLTPCVYPMLTITVSIFGGQKETSTVRVVSRALLYVLGIATMYSILGVAAALTGGLFGGILQSRAVLIGIAALFLVLSLSMFGLYELKPPSGLMNRFGSRKSAGMAGIYVSGLFVGIFAAPCIGPPIIGLLAMVGHRGDPLFGFLAFFILSLGLGFPYLLLGIFSSLLKKLPKSGEWMIWVRKLMGVLLVSVGIFYLSLAVAPGLALVLIPITLVLGGIYLGFIDKSRGSSPRFGYAKRIIGLLLVIAGIFLFVQGQVPSLEWDAYDREAFKPRHGEPAVLYFTADWCVPCLEMDRRTFINTALMRRLGNMVKAKVDLTHFDSPESQELREHYAIVGVPTIVFLDGDREIRNQRIVGFISAEAFLQRIDSAERIIAAGGPYEGNPGRDEEEELSSVRLVADRAWIQPGVPFRLGALFQMKDKWHVYWINPGDSGTAPDMAWELPAGFSAGSIAWPAPQRFDDPPFATYGHEGTLLLAREVLPPADLKPGMTVRFSIDASWLVCDDICVGQDGGAELVLEVKNDVAPYSGAWSRFEDTAALLPVEDAAWQFNARLDGNAIVLEALPPSGMAAGIMQQSEFFPEQPGVVRSVRYGWQQAGDVYTMRMVREQADPGEYFSGVLVLPEGQKPGVLQVRARILR